MPLTAPKQSALQVAKYRAAHQLLDSPVLFNDELALAILGPSEEQALRYELMRHAHPVLKGIRSAVVARSLVAEANWHEARERGVHQLLILGAGLDTLAYRSPTKDARIFEVDLPETQAWKRELLQQANIPVPSCVTHVPLDFEHGTLAQALSEHGFAMDAPACVTWLGVTMYLEKQAIHHTLDFVAALPPGSSVTFDYAVLPELLSPLENQIMQHIAGRTAAQGEVWRSFFDPADLARTLRAMGFGATDDLDAARVNARFLSKGVSGLLKGGVTRIMTARV